MVLNTSILTPVNSVANMLSYQYIKVKPNSLKANATYVFNCTIFAPILPIETVQYFVQVNQPSS